MGSFDNIGQLVHLPLKSIQSEQKTSESEFLLSVASQGIKDADGRNWVPVIVKEVGDYQYQVVSNYFGYSVARYADMERVWCIVIDPSENHIEQARLLMREVKPKVNLSSASQELITEALRYIVAEFPVVFKGFDIAIAADKIATAKRSMWEDLNPILKLKCGITKGKKQDAFADIFFVLPASPLPPAPELVSIKDANRDKIFDRLNYLKICEISGFETLNIDDLADALFSVNKSKWKSLNPLTKLDLGITTAMVKELKNLFSL
jgi:hypothetical protein